MKRKKNNLKLGFQLIILIAMVIGIFKLKNSIEKSAPKIEKVVKAIETPLPNKEKKFITIEKPLLKQVANEDKIKNQDHYKKIMSLLKKSFPSLVTLTDNNKCPEGMKEELLDHNPVNYNFSCAKVLHPNKFDVEFLQDEDEILLQLNYFNTYLVEYNSFIQNKKYPLRITFESPEHIKSIEIVFEYHSIFNISFENNLPINFRYDSVYKNRFQFRRKRKMDLDEKVEQQLKHIQGFLRTTQGILMSLCKELKIDLYCEAGSEFDRLGP